MADDMAQEIAVKYMSGTIVALNTPPTMLEGGERYDSVYEVESFTIDPVTGDTIWDLGDLLRVDTVLVDSPALVNVTYSYFDEDAVSGSTIEDALWAYCGLSGTYVTDESGNEVQTLVSGGSALGIFEVYDINAVFPHHPSSNWLRVKLLRAQACFRMELYLNVVEILLELDPTWDPPDDPFDPDALAQILEKLEEELGDM
jgi:hypothetical protein